MGTGLLFDPPLTVGRVCSKGALAKIEILNLSAALLTHCPSSKVLHMLNKHVLNLGRYDQDWDVRDRARLLAGLLRSVRQPNDGDDEEEENDTGGVVLRPEQIKLVLSDRTNLKQGSNRGESPPCRASCTLELILGFRNRTKPAFSTYGVAFRLQRQTYARLDLGRARVDA